MTPPLTTTLDERPECLHIDTDIRWMGPDFPDRWACMRCGHPFVPLAAHPAPPAEALRAALERLITTVEMLGELDDNDEALVQARAALTAPSAEPVGLDVERLARVLSEYGAIIPASAEYVRIAAFITSRLSERSATEGEGTE